MADKHCSRCDQYKDTSEFYKHKLSIDGLQYWCKPCLRTVNKVYEEKHKEKLKQQRIEWTKNNKEHLSAWAKEWRKKNPEKTQAHYSKSEKNRDLEKRKAWKLLNQEKRNKQAAEWRKRNPVQCRFFENHRRAFKLCATPKWADKNEIIKIYKEAREKSLSVDHIVPLKSKLVCGLHVHFNMQLLTISENSKKSNLYWPDMP
jgi:thiol-disulfide isomerase/thioredoxin